MNDKNDNTATPARAYGRSLSDFEPLLQAEKILLAATARGDLATIGRSRPEKATEANTVRSEFLRFLLLGGDVKAAVHEHGGRLAGAWISGTLDLENSATVCAIDCTACTFSDTPQLIQSNLLGLFLQGSYIPGLKGDGAAIKGDVFLSDSFNATGEIRLIGARIGGDFDCTNSHFDGKGNDAISADRIKIKGGVFLSNGFNSFGTVRFSGATIGSNFECVKSKLNGSESESLCLDAANIYGSLFLQDDFISNGEVRLVGARIGGTIQFNKAKFKATKVDAISADRIDVGGSLFLDDGFEAMGTVRLAGAKIGGDLSLNGANIYSKKDDAICADDAIIRGSVFLCQGFKSTGTVRFVGAEIQGNLEFSDSQLRSEENRSFLGQSMRITGAFVFRSMNSAINKIDLTSASASVLSDQLSSWGSDLILDGFVYGTIGGGASTSATKRLAWLNKQEHYMSGITGDGNYFRPQPWKQLQKVLREIGHTEDARQVAIAFEDRLRHANLIGIAPSHWGRPRRAIYRQISRFFHLCFWALTGYGYRPMRLMAWMVGVWLGCALFYWWAALPPQNVFAPSNPIVFQHAEYRVCIPGSAEAQAELAKPPKQRTVAGAGNWYLCQTLREEYTGFSPLAYSLDVILPLVDLQQQKDWGPMIPTPRPGIVSESFHWSWKHVARFVLWFETLFGWVASLLLVAIVSGLTKRRED